MPLMLLLTFSNSGESASVVIDVGVLLYKLCLYIAFPLLVGKVIQTYSQRVREIVKKRKITMSDKFIFASHGSMDES